MAFLSLFSKKRFNQEEQEVADFVKSLCGVYPKTIQLYQIALTHQSFADRKGLNYNNERLEFLGDAALDMIISDYLYRIYPSKNEGELTQLRSAIVNRQSLGNLANAINLSQFIRTEVDLSLPGVSLPGNALEALIGAIYLDLGYAKANDFVIDVLIQSHLNINQVVLEHQNHKSTLLEWSQKMSRTVNFSVNQIDQPEKKFEAEVRVDQQFLGKAEGRSKKIAEQGAAYEALKALGVK